MSSSANSFSMETTTNSSNMEVENVIQHTGEPYAVKKRLLALVSLQKKYRHYQKEFESKVAELERQYSSFYKPIFEKRAQIVKGSYEPADSEITHLESLEVDSITVQGIPEFWLSVLRNSGLLEKIRSLSPVHKMEMFKDSSSKSKSGDGLMDSDDGTGLKNDEAALKHLTDIRCILHENSLSYSIEFEFEANEFFENKIIKKSFFPAQTDESDVNIREDSSEGTTIQWKDKKNLCKKIISKTQRHKQNNNKRVIQKEVDCISFFSFFENKTKPTKPQEPVGEEDSCVYQDEVAEFEEVLNAEFEIGDTFKSVVIPDSIYLYLFPNEEDNSEEFDSELEDEDDDNDDTSLSNDEDDDDEEEDDSDAGDKQHVQSNSRQFKSHSHHAHHSGKSFGQGTSSSGKKLFN